MTALSDKIAAGRPEETRALLEELWLEMPHDDQGRGADCPRCLGFARKLDAEAYESAVLMLVPEGRSFELAKYSDGRSYAVILGGGAVAISAASLALALAAAIAGSVE